ncbi:hypothetical protein [Deinococcus altitudinis]|uniref:hypothetical protein n=1 Tax=Deinococcus altitudinis TaxID=468914 RepID=UPI0038914CFB
MSKKLGLLLVAFMSLTPATLASDFVSESNLTGFQLPNGALELTDDDFSSAMVENLDDVATFLGGHCKYHELLYWEGNPATIAKNLNAKIPNTFTYKSLGVGDFNDGSDYDAYEQFVLKSPKVWYSGVWFQGDDKATLAWCSVYK